MPNNMPTDSLNQSLHNATKTIHTFSHQTHDTEDFYMTGPGNLTLGPWSNYTSIDYEQDHSDFDTPSYIFYSMTVFYSIIFIVGVLGNVLVVTVIRKNRDMRTCTNICLTSLSISDILVLIICMPTALVEFYMQEVWLFGNVMCKLIPFLENMVSHTSMLTILVISCERFYAICYPINANSVCTKKGTLKALGTVWVISLIVTAPYLGMSHIETATFYDGSMVQICRTPIDHMWKEIYIIILFVLFVFCILFLLIGLYARMGYVLWSQSKDLKDSNANVRTPSHRTRHQVVFMIIAITVLFFISLMPMKMLTLWYVYSPMEDKISLGLEAYLNLIGFSRIMFYLNSAGNPVLYGLASSQFRDACLKTFCGSCRKNHRGSAYNLNTGSRRSYQYQNILINSTNTSSFQRTWQKYDDSPTCAVELDLETMLWKGTQIL